MSQTIFVTERWLAEHDKQIRADVIDEYKHSQMMDKALIIAHAEMFFRWWYQKDIEMGTYSDEEIKGIMSDYLEQLKEQTE